MGLLLLLLLLLPLLRRKGFDEVHRMDTAISKLRTQGRQHQLLFFHRSQTGKSRAYQNQTYMVALNFNSFYITIGDLAFDKHFDLFGLHSLLGTGFTRGWAN